MGGMNAEQVAAFLGVSMQTLHRWLKKGEGPPCKRGPGGRYIFKREDMEAWWTGLPDGQRKGVGDAGEK